MTNRKILVVRNDKLGDFTLALPAFELLKRNMPETRIFALVPEYTQPLAQLSDAIDEIIVDPVRDSPAVPRLAWPPG